MKTNAELLKSLGLDPDALDRSRILAFIGCLCWGMGAALLSHFLVSLL